MPAFGSLRLKMHPHVGGGALLRDVRYNPLRQGFGDTACPDRSKWTNGCVFNDRRYARRQYYYNSFHFPPQQMFIECLLCAQPYSQRSGDSGPAIVVPAKTDWMAGPGEGTSQAGIHPPSMQPSGAGRGGAGRLPYSHFTNKETES